MPRSRLSWPLSLLLGFAVVVALFMAHAVTSPLAAPQSAPLRANCSPPDPNYPDPECGPVPIVCNNPPLEGYPPYADCLKTQAALYTQTAASKNPTSTNTNVPSGGGQQQTAASSTPTRTPTLTTTANVSSTATLTTPVNTRQPTTTIAPSLTAGANTGQPSPTTILPAGVEAIPCIPGETVELTGSATPNISLLVYFDDRPVGGGASSPEGNFRLRMLIGDERPGIYLVEVRERSSRALVKQFGCDIPSLTPTPTAPLVP